MVKWHGGIPRNPGDRILPPQTLVGGRTHSAFHNGDLFTVFGGSPPHNVGAERRDLEVDAQGRSARPKATGFSPVITGPPVQSLTAV